MKKQALLLLLGSCLGLFSLQAMDHVVVRDDFKSIAPMIFGSDSKAIYGIIEGLRSAKEAGRNLTNVCLCGSVGMPEQIAQTIAHEAGLELMYLRHVVWHPDTEMFLRQLTDFFVQAKKSPKKLMIVLDGGRTFVGNRDQGLTHKEQQTLNCILSSLAREESNYMVMILAKNPDEIDRAVMRRCGSSFLISANGYRPDAQEVFSILRFYADRILKEPENFPLFSFARWFDKALTVEQGALSDDVLRGITEKLIGMAGITVSEIMLRIKMAALSTEEKAITPALINQVVEDVIKTQSIHNQSRADLATWLGRGQVDQLL